MIQYCLDTDTMIYFFKGVESVAHRMVVIDNQQLNTTIINHAELLFGAFCSARKNDNLKLIRGFFKNIKILPFCENASMIFADNKAQLKSKGKPLDDLDLMIASICIQNDMTLITNNTKHFSRLKALKIENWLE